MKESSRVTHEPQSLSKGKRLFLILYIVFMTVAPILLWVAMFGYHKWNLGNFTKVQFIFTSGMNLVCWLAAIAVYEVYRSHRH